MFAVLRVLIHPKFVHISIIAVLLANGRECDAQAEDGRNAVGVVSVIECVTDEVVLGTSKTPENATFLWTYSFKSDAFHLLWSDVNSGNKVYDLVAGSTPLNVVWNSFDSGNGRPQFHYFVLSDALKAPDTAFAGAPRSSDPVDFDGHPLGLVKNGRYMVVENFGNRSAYTLWDMTLLKVVGSVSARKNSNALYVSESFGREDNYVISVEDLGQKRGKVRTRIVLLSIAPFEELSSLVVETGGHIYLINDGGSDDDTLKFSVRTDRYGIGTLSVTSPSERRVLNWSAPTDWHPDSGIDSLNWRSGTYYWIVNDGSDNALTLHLSSELSGHDGRRWAIPITRTEESAGHGHYRVSEDGGLLVTCGGGSSFEVWQRTPDAVSLVNRIVIEVTEVGIQARRENQERYEKSGTVTH